MSVSLCRSFLCVATHCIQSQCRLQLYVIVCLLCSSASPLPSSRALLLSLVFSRSPSLSLPLSLALSRSRSRSLYGGGGVQNLDFGNVDWSTDGTCSDNPIIFYNGGKEDWNNPSKPNLGVSSDKRTCYVIPPPGKVNNLGETREEALYWCMKPVKDQGQYSRMLGVNIVPLNPPPLASFATESICTKNSENVCLKSNPPGTRAIPYGHGNCKASCFAGEDAQSQICYPLGLVGSGASIGEDWTIVLDDPTDEIWYSTCFRYEPVRTFEASYTHCMDSAGTAPPICAAVKHEAGWRQGRECISCGECSIMCTVRRTPLVSTNTSFFSSKSHAHHTPARLTSFPSRLCVVLSGQGIQLTRHDAVASVESRRSRRLRDVRKVMELRDDSTNNGGANENTVRPTNNESAGSCLDPRTDAGTHRHIYDVELARRRGDSRMGAGRVRRRVHLHCRLRRVHVCKHGMGGARHQPHRYDGQHERRALASLGQQRRRDGEQRLFGRKRRSRLSSPQHSRCCG